MMREVPFGGMRPVVLLLVLVCICVLLILLTHSSRQALSWDWMPRVFLSVQNFFGKTGNAVRDRVDSLRQVKELRSQYESAMDRLKFYQGLERDVIELRRENAELSRQLGFADILPGTNIPARVVAGDPSNLFSTLTIDKGLRDGLEKDMAVTAFQDGFFGLVGKIVSSGPQSSQVRPIIDPGNYVAARLQKTRHAGLVEGQGTQVGLLSLRYVKKTAAEHIALNDVIVTSGMNSLYPAGLYIGRVLEIRSRDFETSLEITVEPVIDFTRIEYVFVLADDERKDP